MKSTLQYPKLEPQHHFLYCRHHVAQNQHHFLELASTKLMPHRTHKSGSIASKHRATTLNLLVGHCSGATTLKLQQYPTQRLKQDFFKNINLAHSSIHLQPRRSTKVVHTSNFFIVTILVNMLVEFFYPRIFHQG